MHTYADVLIYTSAHMWMHIYTYPTFSTYLQITFWGF